MYFSVASAAVGLLDEPVSEKVMVALLIYDRARVRAPAIWVVLVVEISISVVVERRLRREASRLFSMRVKGRYLFASSRLERFPSSISTSSEEEGGCGYSQTALWL